MPMLNQENSAEATKKIVTMTRLWLDEFNNFQHHYDEIENGYKYLAGEQYDPNALEWYEYVRRPARVFNILFQQFNQVMGEFLLNDQKIKVYARTGGNSRTAAAFQDLIDHVNIQNDIRSTFGNWALSGIIKMGYCYPRFTDEQEIGGSIIIKDVDEFEILFDTAATDYFLDDAKYLARSRWMSKEKILHSFPNWRKKLEPLLIDRMDEGTDASINPDDAVVLLHHHVLHEAEGKYRVIEWHQMDYEPVEVVYDPDTGNSKIWTLEGQKADLYRRLYPHHKVITRRDRVKKITTFIPSLNMIVRERKADVQDRTFDLVPFAAYAYGKKTFKNFGIFKNAIGPQDDVNSWMNLSHAVVQKVIDPGKTYKPSALLNPEAVTNYGNAPGVNFKVKGTEELSQAIKDNEIPKFPFAPEQLSEARLEMLKKITGITDNMSGMSDTSQENASLFAQRVKQGKISLQTIYHNFSRSKRRLYQKTIRLMQENYTSQRFFLITAGVEGAQNDVEQKNLIEIYGASILNDIRQGDFGIVADDQEHNPSARYMRFMQKTEVVQMVIQMFGGMAMPPVILPMIMKWWLSESDLGDIDEFIDAFNQAFAQQANAEAQAGQKQEAFQDINQLYSLAQQKIGMENVGSQGTPRNGTPQKKQAAA